jgi:hypothetical protein
LKRVFEENDEIEYFAIRTGVTVMASRRDYLPHEICLFALALILSFLLLLFGGSPQTCAVPAFLAWLMINRRR